MLFTKELKPKPYPLVNQENADLNAGNNCGPACMAEAIKYLTGRLYDPQTIEDWYYGPGHVGYTTWDFMKWVCDQHNWPSYEYSCTSKSDMIFQLNRSLSKGHITIALIWYVQPSDGRTYGHFVTVSGTWFQRKTRTRHYEVPNTIGGVLEDRTAAELWSVSQNQFFVIQSTPRQNGLYVHGGKHT